MCKQKAVTLPLLALTLAALFTVFAAGPVAAQRSPGRETPPAVPTPAILTPVQDEELVIDRIDVSKYPRLTARFTMRPLNGRPVPYLEVFDILIYANGIWQPVLEAQTVGRVPTTNVGTYEASWISNVPAEAGAAVLLRIGVAVNSRPEVTADSTFIVPLPKTADAPTEAQAPAPLIPVPHPDPGVVDRPLSQATAAILAGVGLLALIAGSVGYSYWKRAQERLAMWVGRSAEHRAKAIARDSRSRRALTISPTTQFFAKYGAKLVSATQGDRMKRMLILAGRPTSQHYTQFVAMKAGLGFVLFMVGFWLMLPRCRWPRS
jgi:hypothetical protein